MMRRVHLVTGEKGHKKARAVLGDFWDGLVSESRRREKGIPYERYRANRLKRARKRA